MYVANFSEGFRTVANLTTYSRDKRHMNLVYDFTDPNCRVVEFTPFSERCNFIHTNKHCLTLTFFLNYLNFYYCILAPETLASVIGCIVLLMLMCLYLYNVLSLVAGNFLTPALTLITKMLKLNENVAGITLLAISNAAPDVLANMTNIANERSTLFSDAFGSAMTSVFLVSGILIIVKPIQMEAFSMVRDILFLILDCLFADYAIISFNGLYMYHGIVCISIYILFIIVVVMETVLYPQQGPPQFKTRDDESSSSDLNEETAKYIFYDKEHTQNELVWWSLSETLRPYDVDVWQNANKFKKAYITLQMPVMFLFKTFIPVVDISLPMHGWCKILHCSQLVTLPTIISLCLTSSHLNWLMSLYIFVMCCPFALFVFLHSRSDVPPGYFKLYTILGIASSAYLVFAIAKEGCAILEVLGMTSHRSSAFLGCTLLSLGNSVGAIVSNFALLKKGYARMGISSCFGVPLFNTLLSLGLTWVYQGAQNPGFQVFSFYEGTMGTTCFIFLTVGLVGILLLGLSTNFVLRRSQGVFQVLLYVTFLLFAILSEFDIIHPYGTDHSMTNKPQLE